MSRLIITAGWIAAIILSIIGAVKAHAFNQPPRIEITHHIATVTVTGAGGRWLCIRTEAPDPHPSKTRCNGDHSRVLSNDLSVDVKLTAWVRNPSLAEGSAGRDTRHSKPETLKAKLVIGSDAPAVRGDGYGGFRWEAPEPSSVSSLEAAYRDKASGAATVGRTVRISKGLVRQVPDAGICDVRFRYKTKAGYRSSPVWSAWTDAMIPCPETLPHHKHYDAVVGIVRPVIVRVELPSPSTTPQPKPEMADSKPEICRLSLNKRPTGWESDCKLTAYLESLRRSLRKYQPSPAAAAPALRIW